MKFKIRETFSDWECADGCCYEWGRTFTINGVTDQEYFNIDYSYDNIEKILNAIINKYCICGYDENCKPLFCSNDLFTVYSLEGIPDSGYDEDYKDFENPLRVLEFLGHRIEYEFVRIEV